MLWFALYVCLSTHVVVCVVFLYVCACMYVHVCMYVCMSYVCMSVCLYVRDLIRSTR